MIPSLRRWVTIAVVWLVSAAFFSAQHQQTITSARAEDYPRLLGAAAVMLIWAILTPPLLLLGNALPIRKPHRVRNALLVSTATAGTALLIASVDVALGLTKPGYPASVGALFHAHLLFSLIVIGVANFFYLENEESARRNGEARGEAEAVEALLRQLRSDLNPHFLFNTLNAVAMLLHTDPAAAERMLDKLHDFLRKAMATEHEREVRLAEELEFVSYYFDIQKMRFADRLTTVIHVSDAHLQNAAVPPLLLQPLIENSIIHGIARLRDGGCVAIVATEERGTAGEFLRIEVRDNGPGCPTESVFASGRVGVANAVARIQSLYGSRQSLTYQRRGDAFVARVLIPLRIIGA